jgi:hypothetical protein
MLKQLVLIIQEFSYSPGENLISVDVADDNSLYLINKGEVEIVFKDKILKTLQVTNGLLSI